MCYLQSLWNLLSLQRFILLTEHGQDPFDKLNAQYKIMLSNSLDSDDESEYSETSSNQNDITDKALSNFERSLMEKICREKKYINTINLFNFISLLYRLIVFKLMKQNLNDENYLYEVNLKEVLVGLIEELNLETELKSEEAVDLDQFDLADFKIKNIYHFWKLIISVYLKKKIV